MVHLKFYSLLDTSAWLLLDSNDNQKANSEARFWPQQWRCTLKRKRRSEVVRYLFFQRAKISDLPPSFVLNIMYDLQYVIIWTGFSLYCAFSIFFHSTALQCTNWSLSRCTVIWIIYHRWLTKLNFFMSLFNMHTDKLDSRLYLQSSATPDLDLRSPFQPHCFRYTCAVRICQNLANKSSSTKKENKKLRLRIIQRLNIWVTNKLFLKALVFDRNDFLTLNVRALRCVSS